MIYYVDILNSELQYSACRIYYDYIIIFADQVFIDFIDPRFFGIFVCGPFQSLVVNVCNLVIYSGCVFTTALVSLNIPEGVLFIDSVKRLKNDRCFHE